MSTLDDLFLKYLADSVEPSDKAVNRAKTAHSGLREDLEKDGTYGPSVQRTLLSGSYGRDTAILHIKDVDVIVQTTFTRDLLQSEKRADETEQQYLLRLTKEAIVRTGRTAKTRTARRSIHVELPQEINDLGEETAPALTLDIVPVLIPADKDHDPMLIADRDLMGWYNTYPNTQLGDSEQRNKRSAIIRDRHNYKPLVKIFKAWKQVHFRSTKSPKGFVLECLAAKYHNPDAEHWAEAVRDLFANICTVWPDPDSLFIIPEVPDISDISPNRIPIAKTIEDARRIIRRIHADLALVKQAIEEAKDDVMESAKTLRRVFGQDCELLCFPLPDDNGGGDNSGGKGTRKSSPFVSRSDVREPPPFGYVS